MGEIKGKKIEKIFFCFLFFLILTTSCYSAWLDFSAGSLTLEVDSPALLSAYLRSGQGEKVLFENKYVSAGKHKYNLKGKFPPLEKVVFILKRYKLKFLKSFGSFGSGPGNFFQPAAITLDNLNRLYIVDSNNDRVQVCNFNGGYITEFGAFKWAEGNIFANRDESAFSSDSLFEENGNNLNDPEDIAVGQFIYVLDKGNNRIVKFNNDYSYLKSIGKYGHGEVEFLDLRSIAIDNIENLYIVDYERDRVIKTDSDGNFLFEVGAFGKEKDNLNRPVAVSVDEKRNFYVAEEGNKRVVVFDENGIFQYEFKVRGLKSLTNIYCWQNFLFLVDSFGKRVHLTTLHGRKLCEFRSKKMEQPVDVAVVNDKYVYIVDREANNVKVFELQIDEEKFTRLP